MKKLILVLILFLTPSVVEAGRWKGLIASVAAYEIQKASVPKVQPKVQPRVQPKVQPRVQPRVQSRRIFRS